MRNISYGVEFGLDEYVRMAELAKTIKGSMLISVNDHPALREVYAGLHMETLGITYTAGGSAKATPTQELLIWNDHCETGARARQVETLALF